MELLGDSEAFMCVGRRGLQFRDLGLWGFVGLRGRAEGS